MTNRNADSQLAFHKRIWRWRAKPWVYWHYSQLNARLYFLHISWCFDHCGCLQCLSHTALEKRCSPYFDIRFRPECRKNPYPLFYLQLRKAEEVTQRSLIHFQFSSSINQRGTAVTKQWPITPGMCQCRSCGDEVFRALDPPPSSRPKPAVQ